MRFGIDARLTYHQRAGIGRYTLFLLDELAKADHENRYTIFQHRKDREPLVVAPNFQRKTLYTPVHSRMEQPLLMAELLFHNLDLIHCTDFIPPLYSSLPSIITVHDLAFLRWPHFLTKDHATYYSQIDRGVRHARHIIVPSHSTKNDVIGQLGVPESKISVIYEAADDTFTPLPMEQARAYVQRHYGLEKPYLLCVGTIEPRKNIIGLLQAFHLLTTQYSNHDAQLAIAGGRGWLFDETMEQVDKLGLRGRVRFLDRVSDEALHHLYVAARGHVHPAFYEGFGLPPLEAMACGTPTIVSNTSSLPEVVQDAALLVDPTHPEEIAVAMNRLLADDALHAELRSKGLQRATCFSWRRAAQATLEVYRRVADPRALAARSGVTSIQM